MLSSGQQIVNLTATQLNIGGVEQIELTWQSINENGWCYFVIERDTNNNGNFTPYDTLSANGSTTDTTNYLFTDFGPLQSNIIYSYRLRLDTMYFPTATCYFNSISDTVSISFTTSLGELSNSNTFKIFPNPSNGIVSVQGDKSVNSIKIYNAIGEIVYEQTNQNSAQFTIDISDKPNGIYFIVINSENNFYNHKLIKQ